MVVKFLLLFLWSLGCHLKKKIAVLGQRGFWPQVEVRIAIEEDSGQPEFRDQAEGEY